MPAVDVRRWTRDEYERMIRAGIFAPEERVELIDGEILHVYPQDSLHATGISLALKALTVAFRKGFEVRPRLSLALDPRSQPEPDIAVVRGSARDYRDHHPETAVLILEVADFSLTFDQGPKASVYARAGIADYWIVNLVDQRLEVYRNPVPDRDCYSAGGRYERGESVAPLAAPESSKTYFRPCGDSMLLETSAVPASFPAVQIAGFR